MNDQPATRKRDPITRLGVALIIAIIIVTAMGLAVIGWVG